MTTTSHNALLEIINLQINSAIEDGSAMHIKSMSAFLARILPDSGMTEEQISQLVAQLGVERRVPMEFG